MIATLRNPVYLGLFRDKGDFRIGHHEAIVTHDLFAAVSAQLAARRTGRSGARYQIDWPLKGRITCAVCGTPMSAHTIRYRKFLYRYYRCRSTAGGQRPCGHQVSASDIEGGVRQHLETLWNVHLGEGKIRDHVESVVYDHRDHSVRAVFIRPPAPATDPDSKEVDIPLGKRERRKA